MRPNIFCRRERRVDGKLRIAWLLLMLPGCVVQVPDGTDDVSVRATTFSVIDTGPVGMAVQPCFEETTTTYGQICGRYQCRVYKARQAGHRLYHHLYENCGS